jgi:hypothetical protein
VVVEGGIVNVSVMRTTITGSGKTSYLQTGGTVIVRGNETEVGEMSSYPIFSIPNPSSSFMMSGGEIIIKDKNNGTGAAGNGLYLTCDPENFSVTGGTITFETNPANTPSVDLNSRVTLWYLNVKSSATSGISTVTLLNNLAVYQDLNVYQNSTLHSGTGNFQVTVGGDFRINEGGFYTPNNNLTLFNGFGYKFLWNMGSINSGLYNLQVNKVMGGLILVSATDFFNIRNDLTVTKGVLADGGKTVYVSGNVINNDSCVGAGKISLNKTNGIQTISGNGQGKFQNLEIANTTGGAGTAQVFLKADAVVTGNLILQNDRLFDISTYRLTLTSLAEVLGTMSSTRFIRVSGLASDGGVRKIYADTTLFLFPVGSGTNYTPATVHVRKVPTTYGSVTVTPVPLPHPFVTDPGCLSHFWKVTGSGFTGIKTGSVGLTFNYGNLPDNTAFVPGRYVPAAWDYTNDITLVDEASNLVLFPAEDDITGDYTAGIPEAFGLVTAFYSRDNGDWESPSTWSNESHTGLPAVSAPAAGNPVFIGDGAGADHTVTVTAGMAKAGSLSVKTGSILNLGTTVSNNLGFVLPGSYGKIRISSDAATAEFPAGDFGNFLGHDGGTLEYYSETVGFTLPLVSAAPSLRPVTSYCHLQLSPLAGHTITMPNEDLEIFGNMIVTGEPGAGQVSLNATASRTLMIRDNLEVSSGNLLFQNNSAQNLRIDSNIVIGTEAGFMVSNSGTAVANYMSVGENLVNNGTFDMSPGTSYRCDILFNGDNDAVISGSGPVTRLYSLTIDKGNSTIPTLNVTANVFTFAENPNPLTLLNGTFRLTRAITVNVATNALAIPPTACLSANGGTIIAASAASDDADIKLAGELEIRAGSIIVGDPVNNKNNDVEYAGAGAPTIEIQGGSLFVNGQIRRNLINGLGSLTYKQSGTSSVTINARNAQPTRAKLELLNPGSVFIMIGGTLTIVRGASSTYNDLYLRPQSSTVTGGTVIFGNGNTENVNLANYFTLESAIALNNVTVDGTTTPKTVTLGVHGLTLKGNLEIQATSVFDADSLDVNIAGNLTNLNTDAGTGINTGGFRPGSFRQVTLLNGEGTSQLVTGATGNLTNFANLIIRNTNPSGIIALQANTAIRVNTDLTLDQGTLSDGGNVITVIGNISNSATHTGTGTGRIVLAGSTVQVLSGNGLGKFRNVYLNATNDVVMTSPMEITGVLTFQTKMLNIGNNLLKISNTAATAVAGATATSYIRLNGLISDAGVQKSFPSGALDFTFPVGVYGKYTPARLRVTANTAPGTLTVVPVNSKHPCTTDPADLQLTYYWHVVKTGFSGLAISHYYTYVDADIRGTEANYVAARFNAGVWSTTGGSMSTTTNQLRFLTASFADGDYTAGYPSEFGVVSTYYSRNEFSGGNWEDLLTWSTVSHAGPAAATYPDGQPVVIASGHTVFAHGTSRRALTLALNGTGILDLENTVGHDFGTVTGTGTIKLISSDAGFFVFPSGNFADFTSPAGGTIVLNTPSGDGVFPYLTSYNKLILRGSGNKMMIDADILVNGTLTNEAPGKFTASSVGRLSLAENWVNDGSFAHNGGTILCTGNSTFSGILPPVVNHLIIEQGKSLTGPASVAFGIAGNFENNGSFTHNSGTVVFSGSSTIRGSSTTTFNNITIANGKSLTGRLNNNIVILGNIVDDGEFHHNGGTFTFDGNSLIGGTEMMPFGNVVINSGRSLTGPPNGSVGIALDFTNNGTFAHNNGTVVFNGASQNIDGSSSTAFEILTVDKGSTTTILSAGQTIRGILLSNGVLNANGKLTLLSDMQRTALVDGSGEGDIFGNLVIQRYLASGFGYKYFSSPFHAADVGQFGEFMDLQAAFPTFYSYDENRFFTGWRKFTNPANILTPMHGYAVNFGPSTAPITFDLEGEVNNRALIPYTMFNSNRPFTTGFNLIGNPYPSPIDWDAPEGWVRTNIDDALYYFNAGGADQYTGVYSSYVNGISSDGIANNILATMQGAFIHVSDGAYPVAATLIFTNQVRVNDLTPTFHKSALAETRPLLRFTARMAGETAPADPLIVYFENEATAGFDSRQDALKLINTEVLVPSIYAFSDDGYRLSIDALPVPVESLTVVPLGFSTDKDGWFVFQASDIERMMPGTYIYFADSSRGICQEIRQNPVCRIYLKAGKYENNFALLFSTKDLRYQPPAGIYFHVYTSRGKVFAYLNLESGEKGNLAIFNMLGQKLLSKELSGNGYHEIDMNLNSGIYIIAFYSTQGVLSKKVYLSNE